MSTTDSAAGARPDENTLVMPDAWLRERHPRRDRPGPWPDVRVDEGAADAARALVEPLRFEIERILKLPGTTPALGEHGLAYLRGEADPLGAAVVAEVAVCLRGLGGAGRTGPFRDAWVAEYGLPFAAAAYVELFEVSADCTVIASRYDWKGVQRRPPGGYIGEWFAKEEAARHLRALLATADDAVYEEAVERLSHCRATPMQQTVAAYLVPTREDWVVQAGANFKPHPYGHEGRQQWMLLCALGEPYQVDAFGLELDPYQWSPGSYATLMDGVGPAAMAGLVSAALDAHHGDEPHLLDVLAMLPVDEAFQALLDRIGGKHAVTATTAAARRFPARALRLLAASANRTAVAELLSAHVRANLELTDELLPSLPEESRTVVEKVRAAETRVPVADPAELPPLLVDPPWNRPRKKAKPVVIKDLPPPDAPSIMWKPGERDAWTADLHHRWRWVERLEWPVQVAKYQKDELDEHLKPVLFAQGPDELVRPLLVDWTPPEHWYVDEEWLRVVVARFELDALDGVLTAAGGDPANLGGALLPFLSDDVARLMADWLVRLKVASRTARAWFARHGLAAVPALLPDTLGKAGARRRAAEAALRFVASRQGAEGVVAAARVHGDKAAGAVEALLASDPLELLPAKIPVAGDWADARLLPQILLRGAGRALPDDAAAHVVTMLAMSKPGDAYAGVDAVRELCDAESLARFSWALFRRWEAEGAPSKEGWALAQLALFGDDDTVRRLTPVIRAWPGEAGHAKAVTGLDVLAAIGTDVALMHLHSIAQKVKFKGLRTRAQEKIAEVAAELELTPEQLADRLVPDFGLDANGSMTLDYGPRRFVVGFDEQLRPYVADEDGTRRKALPKPGAKDDPDLAPAAYKAFSVLKKDVRTVAADQIARLERAMVTRRRWSLTEFRELLAAHPLVRHLVRRLVWIAVEMDQYKSITFRVAEDGTFASVDDGALRVPETVVVGVAHPVNMQRGGQVAAWSEVFADYEILQPFPQLGRAVHALTEEERAAGNLARFEGATVPVGRVLGLVKRGWERGEPQDAGVECWISRPLPDGRHLVIDLDPGIAVGVPDMLGDQTLRHVALCARPEQLWYGEPSKSLRLGELDPVTASEVIADLTTLTADAG